MVPTSSCRAILAVRNSAGLSRHIHADDAAAVEKGVDNYKLFRELVDRFVTLTEQITRLADGQTDSKKNSSPRKSRTNDSGKPKPS